MRRAINNVTDLKAAIAELESKKPAHEVNLKQNFAQVKDNLQPKRVLQNTFNYAVHTPEINKILIGSVVGFAIGYASRKATQMVNERSLDSLIQNVVNTGVNKLETKNPESKISQILRFIRQHVDRNSSLHPFIGYTDRNRNSF